MDSTQYGYHFTGLHIVIKGFYRNPWNLYLTVIPAFGLLHNWLWVRRIYLNVEGCLESGEQFLATFFPIICQLALSKNGTHLSLVVCDGFSNLIDWKYNFC